MDQTYWILQYGKVLLGYLFLMYLWPTVVFRPILKGKDRAYRFCFCVNVTVLLAAVSVLLLGLVHLLNQTLVTVLFYGIFLVQLYRNYHLSFSWIEDVRSVSSGVMSTRRMLLKWHTANTYRLKTACRRWWKSTEGRRLEYVTLVIVVLFGMAYFSINALQLHSYGCGDQYIHHAWIYDMKQGKVFSAGIYPQGMHSFIYLLSTVFHIDLYSCVLFLAGIHVQVLLVSAYLLGRALFGWRMSGLFALVGFLTVDQVSVNSISGMSRISWTLPQEFALYTVFLAAYGLIRFLESAKDDGGKLNLFRRDFWMPYLTDHGLFILASTLAVSIFVHYYATIIAAVVCLVTVVVNLRQVFRRAVLARLVAGVLAALLIAGFPIGVARLAGYPLQGSLLWAMSVIQGNELEKESEELIAKNPEDEEDDAELGPLHAALDDTYFELYGDRRGGMLAIVDASVACFGALALLLTRLLRGGRNRNREPLLPVRALKGYLIISITLFVLFIAYEPSLVGLPAFVKDTRICSSIDLFAMLLCACVPDVIFTLAHRLLKAAVMVPVSAAACVGIYLVVLSSGFFHGYLYYELTRYPAAVELTKEITRNLPKYEYTVISTTDELYQLRETGFHEEWIDMIEQYKDKTYTIPTPFLFFYIEKQPLLYAQYSFATGPRWLAEEKYVPVVGKNAYQYPEIGHGEVSTEASKMKILYTGKRSFTETDFDNRIILESKAYSWLRKFRSYYPTEGTIIYEDDDLLCYCVHQEEFSPFSLGVVR